MLGVIQAIGAVSVNVRGDSGHRDSLWMLGVIQAMGTVSVNVSGDSGHGDSLCEC